VKLAAWKTKKPDSHFWMSDLKFPKRTFYRSIHSTLGTCMPKLIERVLAHLILPSLSKSKGLLSSRQANVQPTDHSIRILNVKHKRATLVAGLWKTWASDIWAPRPWIERVFNSSTNLPRTGS
jgi:hypothetical protein